MNPPDIPGYDLIRELGAGGMATVFLANQTSLDRRVAIKVMRRGANDGTFEQRFLREGRTMAKLPHRNIAAVHDIVQTADLNYIAMEYLSGGTLSERMKLGLSLADAVSIVVQIASALQFAHDAGVVHRDLKPANIMFRDPVTPVLTDFGIARQADAEASRLTQTGMMIGTPTYMSPEQAMAGDIDGRSDQYSLGILFYEMLTGRAPFRGESPLNVVLAHLNEPPPPLPTTFAHFQPLLDRLLAKDRADRFPDLHQFSRELKSALMASHTLMAQLHIDPSASASEQLRGLGFSDSQINTGARDSASAYADALAGRGPAKRREDPSTGGVRMRPSPPSPKRFSMRSPLGIGVAVGALLVVLIGGWFAMSRDDLDPAVRAVVNDSLAAVDRLIEAKRYVAPVGDNAFEKLQAVLQLAPELPEALEQLERIRTALVEAAETELTRGNFDAAEASLEEASAVVEDPARLAPLKAKITSARLAADRARRVDALLAEAEALSSQGQLSGSGRDNALARLREARAVDPDSAAAASALARLTESLLAPATDAIKTNDIASARTTLDRLRPALGAEPAWTRLDALTSNAEQQADRRARLDALLAQGQRQIKAGQLAEPAGDNALDTLARSREIDAATPATRNFANQLADALGAAAKSANNPVEAIALYEQALSARPDDKALTASRDALRTQLSAAQRELSAILADARESMAQRRLLPPASGNASDALDRALALAPNDAEARRLADALPGLVQDTIGELRDEDRLDEAAALAAAASSQWPADRELAALNTAVAGRAEAAKREASRREAMDDLRRRVAAANHSAAEAADLAAKFALLDGDPAAATAVAAARAGFVAQLERELDAAATAAEIGRVNDAISAAAKADPKLALAGLNRRAGAELAALAAAEQQRLATTMGTLVVTAAPWAEVVAVTEQGSGRTVELPRERSTPLRLAVPAGTYRMTLRHPAVKKTVTVVAQVQPKREAVARGSFPTISADAYLERAGYGK